MRTTDLAKAAIRLPSARLEAPEVACLYYLWSLDLSQPEVFVLLHFQHTNGGQKGGLNLKRGPFPPPDTMKLTDNVLRSFRVAKVFRENSDKINCFDFSTNGETIISSSDDDSLVLYDCQEGK